MVSDLMTIVIWCIGIVGMALTAWVQDRRDIRRETGELAQLRKEFEERLRDTEADIRALKSEIARIKASPGRRE